MEELTVSSTASASEGREHAEDDKVILLPIQARPSSGVPLPISVERIAELLQNAGYKGVIVETEDRTFVESSAEGWKFRVFLYDDRKSGSNDYPTSIMLNAGWGLDRADAEAIYKAANIFNMKFRFLKAYVVVEDEYTYTEAEMSLFCPDGLSGDTFNAFLEMFINLRQSYVSICRESLK